MPVRATPSRGVAWPALPRRASSPPSPRLRSLQRGRRG